MDDLDAFPKPVLQDPVFAPFAIKVLQFAEAFLLDELEEFIKQYMDGSA